MEMPYNIKDLGTLMQHNEKNLKKWKDICNKKRNAVFLALSINVDNYKIIAHSMLELKETIRQMEITLEALKKEAYSVQGNDTLILPNNKEFKA